MLHPLAQDGIIRLTADFARDTLLDFFSVFHDRIDALNRVASRTTRRPASQDDIDRLDAPIVVGQTVLRRPSPAAMQWLADCASVWWAGRRRAWTYALAYACAHRDKAAFDGLFSRVRASLICWRFAISIKASEEAIRRAALALLPPSDDALEWFIPPDAEAAIDDPRQDLAGLALMLGKQFGGKPGYWLWEVADDDFWAAVSMVLDEAEHEADPEHNNPDSWWRRHRRALLACETALEADVRKWVAARQKAQEAPDVG